MTSTQLLNKDFFLDFIQMLQHEVISQFLQNADITLI